MSFRISETWLRLASLPFIRNFSLNLGLLCLLLCLNVFTNGYELAVYNSIQAMNPFIATFGTCNAAHVCSISTANLSMLNSFPLLGYAGGIVIASLVGEPFGRRLVYVLVILTSLAGIAVSYSATTYEQILAGRIIVNASVGMESWLIPLFQGEIVPAQVRGTIVSLYVTCRLIGSLIVSCITYQTSFYTDNSSWKTPLAIMFAVPAFCLCFAWYVPESPRWLLRKGKDEKALQVLHRLYGNHEMYDAELELVLLRQSLELEVEKGSWIDLVRGTNLRRTLIAMASAFFSNSTGFAFASQYGVVFLKTLGTINAFQFNVINTVAGLLGTLVFIFLVDRVGRRFFYLVFAPLASLSMIVIGGLSCATTLTTPMKNGIAAMFPLFGFFYLCSFAPLPVLTGAEIPSLKLRDKTAMSTWTVHNFVNFIASFTVPYLLNPGYANLSSKVGFIYGGIGLFGVVWAYFYFPELKQRSLEEIDEMMREGVPARKTKGWKTSADSIGAKLTNIEVTVVNTVHDTEHHEKSTGVEVEHAEV